MSKKTVVYASVTASQDYRHGFILVSLLFIAIYIDLRFRHELQQPTMCLPETLFVT